MEQSTPLLDVTNDAKQSYGGTAVDDLEAGHHGHSHGHHSHGGHDEKCCGDHGSGHHGHGHGHGGGTGGHHGHSHGDHHEEHESSSGKDSSYDAERRLIIATIFCFIFLGVEVVGGIFSHSVAVLSDAVHLLGDVSAFVISIAALRLARVQASPNFTFGLARAETLGALASTLITWALTGVLVYEAGDRFLYFIHHDGHMKDEVDGRLMSAIAAGGVFVNIILMCILSGGEHGHTHSRESGTPVGRWASLFARPAPLTPQLTFLPSSLVTCYCTACVRSK